MEVFVEINRSTLDSDGGSFICSLVVPHVQGDARLDAVGYILVNMRDMHLTLAAQQCDGLIDVAHGLGVYFPVCGTGFTLRTCGCRFSVDWHAESVFMADVTAGKSHGQIMVSIGTERIGITHYVIDFCFCSYHRFLCCQDVIDLADDGVIIVPGIVRAPGRGAEAAFDIVVVVIPEPAGSLCGHDHVFAHQIAHQGIGLDAEALVVVARRGLSPTPDETKCSVEGHESAFCILQHEVTGNSRRRYRVKKLLVARGCQGH